MLQVFPYNPTIALKQSKAPPMHILAGPNKTVIHMRHEPARQLADPFHSVSQAGIHLSGGEHTIHYSVGFECSAPREEPQHVHVFAQLEWRLPDGEEWHALEGSQAAGYLEGIGGDCVSLSSTCGHVTEASVILRLTAWRTTSTHSVHLWRRGTSLTVV